MLLVRVETLPVSFGLAYEEGRMQWHLMRDDRAAAEDYLRLVARSDTLRGISVETFVEMGAAASVILDVSAARDVDLVVLTRHGRTGVPRWILGSVAGHIVHHSLVPVLVLRTGDVGASQHAREAAASAGQPTDAWTDGGRLDGDADANPQPLRVLVPLDGSPLAETALAPAAALGRALAGPRPVGLSLLVVVTPYTEFATNTPEALLVGSAQGYLERVAQRLRADWHDEVEAGAIRISTSTAVEGDVAGTILAAAAGGVEVAGTVEVGAGVIGRAGAASDYDLIALTTHGRTGFARWSLGSVTERLLNATALPLLIVRPQSQ